MGESFRPLAGKINLLPERLSREILSFERLGGGNSGAYRLHTVRGLLLLKKFSGGPLDRIIRLKRELNFLRWAERQGVGSVPKVVEYSYRGSWIVSSHVEGTPIFVPKDWHFEAAGAFVAGLRYKIPRDFRFFLRARDSLTHAKSMRTDLLRRHRGIVSDLSGVEHGHGWRGVVLTKLEYYLRFQMDSDLDVLERMLRSEDGVARGGMIMSPSDFGFHNFLEDVRGESRKLWFVDFEYGGIDSPINLIMDFFCNPNSPTESRGKEVFLAQLHDLLKLSLDDIAPSVWRLFCVKWLLIVSKKQIVKEDGKLSPGDSSNGAENYLSAFHDRLP